MTPARRVTRVRRLAVGAALVLTAAGAAGLVGVPALAAPGDEAPSVGQVVVVGVAGLRLDDLDASRTPELARLAGRGSIGALSVRSAATLTCPADGWVTLGAGNRSVGPAQPEGQVCPSGWPAPPPVPTAAGGGQLTAQDTISGRNAGLDFGAVPGALAAGVGCATAVGPAAAVAAAHPTGRVDGYAARLPADPAGLLARCTVTIVSGPTVDDTGRAADLAAVDRVVGAVERARRPGSLLIVVGVADVGPSARLHVALADGPGFAGGRWLVSGSTRRNGYVQLVDVAPTVVAALALPPVASMAGQPMTAGARRDGSAAAAVAELVDADRAAVAHQPLVQPFFGVLVVANLALMAYATVLFLRRRPRAVGDRGGPSPTWPALMGPLRAEALEIVAVALAAVPAAGFAANLLAWWRSPVPVLTCAALVLAGVAAGTVLAYRGPWRHRPFGPPGCVAVCTGLILGLDVLTGSNLQLHALAGYSALVAGRFVGFGNLAFAVFAAGCLLGAACLAQATRGWRRTAVFAGTGAVAVLLTGAGAWGNDVGGIVALTPAFVIATLQARGSRLSAGRILAALMAGILTVSAFAAVDYARPAEQRTHLGRFVADLFDGTAGTVIRRKAEANLSLLVDSQLTLLVLAVALFVPLVLFGPGGLRRVHGLYPCIRAGFTGTAVAAGIGFAVNDSGVAVPAFAAMVAVPLAIAVALRVAATAGQGTRPRHPAGIDAPPRPRPDRTCEDVVS